MHEYMCAWIFITESFQMKATISLSACIQTISCFRKTAFFHRTQAEKIILSNISVIEESDTFLRSLTINIYI